jgi:hypothetical protein
MVILWSEYASGSFVAASVLALVGTNAQARLTKERFLSDPNPLVVEASRLWTPTRWATGRQRRKKRGGVERKIQANAEDWLRYQSICNELFAWNALETSVAIAAVASVVAFIGPLVQPG